MDASQKSRLRERCKMLELIHQWRAAHGNPRIGSYLENFILDRELRELESISAPEAGARVQRHGATGGGRCDESGK